MGSQIGSTEASEIRKNLKSQMYETIDFRLKTFLTALHFDLKNLMPSRKHSLLKLSIQGRKEKILS